MFLKDSTDEEITAYLRDNFGIDEEKLKVLFDLIKEAIKEEKTRSDEFMKAIQYPIVEHPLYLLEEQLKIWVGNYDILNNPPYPGSLNPLQMACVGGNVEIVKKLIGTTGVNLNYIHQGHTPLTLSIDEGKNEIVSVLCASEGNLTCAGVDVNLPASSGLTPLMSAVFKNNVEVAKILIAMPAINLNYVTAAGSEYGEGYTALKFAENESEEICELLKGAGAQ